MKIHLLFVVFLYVFVYIFILKSKQNTTINDMMISNEIFDTHVSITFIIQYVENLLLHHKHSIDSPHCWI